MILAEFLVVLYADHVRFHPCRESTDSLRNSYDGLYYNTNTEWRHSLARCRMERLLGGGETTARCWGQRRS